MDLKYLKFYIFTYSKNIFRIRMVLLTGINLPRTIVFIATKIYIGMFRKESAILKHYVEELIFGQRWLFVGQWSGACSGLPLTSLVSWAFLVDQICPPLYCRASEGSKGRRKFFPFKCGAIDGKTLALVNWYGQTVRWKQPELQGPNTFSSKENVNDWWER